MNFANRLKKAIAEQGISQAELARRLGVKAQSVNGWCNADIFPRMEVLTQLESATGYPLYWFFLDDSTDGVEIEQPQKRIGASHSDDENRLLSLFRQLPTNEERERIIISVEERLQEIEDVAKAFLATRKISKNK